MKSLGIDIGSHQVKVVEIQTSARGVQVVNSFAKTLGRAQGTDLELEVIEFLRELLGKYDPSSTKFCFSLRQDQVAVRHRQFPFNDRNKIQKSLPFELEDELPFSTENAVYDGKIIHYYGSSAEVLACATPKNHIEHLLRLAKDCSIQPSLVSCEATALANLFEAWNQPIPLLAAPPPNIDENFQSPPRPIKLLLQIGHQRTVVCAIENGKLVGARSIAWGGRIIIDAIAKKYSLAPSEAQKEFEAKAFILTTKQEASYEAKIFSDLIGKSVRELVRELQLSMLEFKSEFNGFITDIQITGGASGIQGLAPFLTQQLEVPVNKFQPFDHFENLLIERSDDQGRRFGLALALAIEGLRKPRNPSVNFMKGEFAAKSSFAKDLWADWGPYLRASAAASLFIFIWAFFRGDVTTVLEETSQQVLSKQAQEVAKLPKSKANQPNLQRYVSASRKKINELRTLQSLAGMNSAMDILLLISERAGDRQAFPVDIRSLIVEDDRVQMTGALKGGKDRVDALGNFLQGAAEAGSFKISSSPGAPGKTNFSASFKVDRNITKVNR